MKRFILVAAIALVISPTAAKAHPPVSVVMDSRGNVFYSDLTHVWRISSDGFQRGG